MNRVTFKAIIEDASTKNGKRFDLFTQLLIVLSLVSFSVKTLPNISDWVDELCWITEVITILFFTFEYIARIYVADKKTDYIFSFFGMVDLLSILPFYLSAGLDLRSLRSFRLFRLIRLLKLARYNTAADRFYRAFSLAREEIILLLITMMIILYVAGVGIYYFEHDAQPEAFASIFHGLWWAVSTLTTVGYGDVYPITIGGKVFTFVILVLGLGVIAIPAGLFASALSRAKEDDLMQKEIK